MKRLLLVSLTVAALAVSGVAVAATIITNPADKTKLAFQKKTLVAKPGSVTIIMPNPSALPHDVRLRAGVGAKGATIAKGKVVGKGGVSKFTTPLKKGKYRFFCSVPGHEAGGMWGILTVK